MNVLFFLFSFFCFFPYLRLIPISGTGDTQPLAVVMAIVLFFLFLGGGNIKIRKEYFILFGIFVFSMLVCFFSSGFSLIALRSLVGYFSLFIISLVFLFFFKRGYNLSDFYIKVMIYIWGGVALIQKFIHFSFLSFILPRATSTELRGVVSLAPEPSYYGIMCLFFLFFSVFQLKNRMVSVFLLFQIIFLAKSSLLIMVLLFILIAALFIYRKYLILFIALFIFPLVSIPLVSYFLPESRVHFLLKLLLEDPVLAFQQDGSMNDRLSGIYFSIKGFIQHLGMPSGIDTYHTYITNELKNQVFFDEKVISTTKIMSAYGGALFELGVVGLFIPFLFYKAIKHYFGGNQKLKWAVFISFSLLMINPVPIALPVLGYLYSYLLFNRYNMIKNN